MRDEVSPATYEPPKHPRLLTALCIGLGLLLAVELPVWLWHFMTVVPDHEGLNSNTYSDPLTGPFLGPSRVDGYGVASDGRDLSADIAVVMAGADFCAIFGLVVRSVALRSRAFTFTAVAHSALAAWCLALFAAGYTGFAVAGGWFALITGYCALIRRVAPVQRAGPPRRGAGRGSSAANAPR
ncbi:hypothetical protein [Yinghuangia seranimata]|uniref:hypothetical protein n=1 Tax=Yinghuangia seranimata TaxID=408067 RepID=UPI00248C944B|nr:hypothetical protein [Yinghuangia seranimata]MDI2132594.1 hypothetical protein [Yinghuangia seranimata]